MSLLGNRVSSCDLLATPSDREIGGKRENWTLGNLPPGAFNMTPRIWESSFFRRGRFLAGFIPATGLFWGAGWVRREELTTKYTKDTKEVKTGGEGEDSAIGSLFLSVLRVLSSR